MWNHFQITNFFVIGFKLFCQLVRYKKSCSISLHNAFEAEFVLYLMFDFHLLGSYLSNFLQNSLKNKQIDFNSDKRSFKPIARLREPKDLLNLPKEIDCTQQSARWPVECQVRYLDTFSQSYIFFCKNHNNVIIISCEISDNYGPY